VYKVSLFILLMLSFSVFADKPDAQRQKELRNLLQQDCGSCHGMTRKGGLGPALTVEALKGKPIEYLTFTISEGRPGTPMPPWKYLLSESDINWLALALKQEMVAEQ
jgi:cytochrome c55X